MDDLDKVDLLPPVEDIPKLNISTYYEISNAFIEKASGCPMAKMFDLTKVVDWCKYLNCSDSGCTIPKHPAEEISSSNVTNNVTLPECYDDYTCDAADNAWLLFIVFGIVLLVLCSASLFSNLICLVAFNKALNRTGATLYFSVISVTDSIHLGVLILLHIPRYIHRTYQSQLDIYATKTAYFVPLALPWLTFSELASVWLTLAVLVDRYLYLRLGFFSRSVTSRILHLQVTATVLFFSLGYSIPKFFEYELQESASAGRYRVILTSIGKSIPYRNLMDYLLSVPIEMFLPYLSVGLLTCIVVSKMVDFGSTKWETVVSLCSRSRYRSSFGCCACGDDFANCNILRRKLNRLNSDLKSAECIRKKADGCLSSISSPSVEKNKEYPIYYCGIPFEKRSSLLPLYFLVPPPKTETQESANVVITVCIGFLLLVTKIPKLILHILTIEQYVILDEKLVSITNVTLDLVFMALKPLIYLVLGVHFRHALTGLCCCACLYTPVISTSHVNEMNQRPNSTAYSSGVLVGDEDKTTASLIDESSPKLTPHQPGNVDDFFHPLNEVGKSNVVGRNKSNIFPVYLSEKQNLDFSSPNEAVNDSETGAKNDNKKSSNHFAFPPRPLSPLNTSRDASEFWEGDIFDDFLTSKTSPGD